MIAIGTLFHYRGRLAASERRSPPVTLELRIQISSNIDIIRQGVRLTEGSKGDQKNGEQYESISD